MMLIDIVFLLVGLSSPQTFSCTVNRVHDGDGPLWCAEGPKVRIAGIQAPDFESAEPCRQRRARYVCSDARARASQRTVSALVLHRRLTCQALEPSYSRIVARCRLLDGRDLSCAVLAAGAATRWERYWQRYRMGSCPSPAARGPLSSSPRGKRVDLAALKMEAAVDGDGHPQAFVLGKVEVPVQHLGEGSLRDVLTHRAWPAAQIINDDGPGQASFLTPEEVIHADLSAMHSNCAPDRMKVALRLLLARQHSASSQVLEVSLGSSWSFTNRPVGLPLLSMKEKSDGSR